MKRIRSWFTSARDFLVESVKTIFRPVLVGQKGFGSTGSLFSTLVLVLLGVAVVPVAVDAIVGVDVSGWTDIPGAAAIWPILGLLIIVGFVYMLGKKFGIIGSNE